MRIPISKITRELDIKSFQLHKWEERGWLGTEPVLKDPDNNGQRIYSEQQVERIEFIDEVIKDQENEGFIERILKYGGKINMKFIIYFLIGIIGISVGAILLSIGIDETSFQTRFLIKLSGILFFVGSIFFVQRRWKIINHK